MKYLIICSSLYPSLYTLLPTDDTDIQYHGIFSNRVKEDLQCKLCKTFEHIFFIENYDRTVETHARKLCDQYVYSNVIGLNESDILICAKIRNTYEIQGMSYQNAILYRNKILMKTKLLAGGIRVPKFKIFNSLDTSIEEFDFPFILKPVDSSGSRDVHVIYTKESFKPFTSAISATSAPTMDMKFEIEEYIEGDMYHIDGSYQNGKVAMAYPSKYVNPCAATSYDKIDCSYILAHDNLCDRL